MKKNAEYINNSVGKEEEQNINNLRQLIFVSAEMKKEDYGTSIRDEYMEKTLLYGYIMVNK